MPLTLYTVDAFTDRAFAGTPAAVCVLPAERDPAWMQRLAREMNLSETAFLVRGDGHWHLRWFTPTVEVNLCGHATLASAHVLVQLGLVKGGEDMRFMTRSGLLIARRDDDRIEMDFPARVALETPRPDGLLEALGADAAFIGRSVDDYLVEVASEDIVRQLKPNHSALRRLPVRGVTVTARASTPGFDFVSRFFAPGSGIDEDPVTGSAHCTLAPHWSARLGRSRMVGYQASHRGGVVHVDHRGDRVMLIGHAVTVLRSELLAEV